VVETVHEKLPDTKVLLLGVFPRATKGHRERKGVEEINRIIARLDDAPKTKFLDIGDKFLDEHGEIPDDVMPDKLHPTPKGYDIWYDAIHSVVEEMMSQPGDALKR
jgi:lysophospholipase L1-like esterase